MEADLDETGDVAEAGPGSPEMLEKLKIFLEERNAKLAREAKAAAYKREHRREGSWRPKKARNQKKKR